jgi:predicted P-loop ATPase
VRPEQVEGHIRAELQQRGVEYIAGNHNNYIAQSCYLMNRYGVSEADCTEWAVNRFSDYQDSGNNVAGIVASCYQQTKEHATRRPPREERGGQATVAQIEAFLAEHVHLRRNVVTGFVEVLTLNDNDNVNDNCLPDGKVNVSVNVNVREGWRQFTDDDRNSLWRALSRELGVRVVRQDISAVVKSDFSPRYHPFEEYIGSLQPWDGETDHIDRLASMVTVCGDQNYFRRVFKKWLVAFIAAIFDPEEVNHEILVFIGRQGCYKSTWFHYLLPPELRQYFLPKLMSNSGITKDDLFKIAQSGLVCLEEIDNMKQRDLNQLKALTTMRTINERRSYGEFNELHRHIASFCATGNNRFFLTDHTGNRRFLTFEIESIVPPQTYEYNYEGVYAQAYALWRQGYRYWFNDEENDEINQCNTEFESPNKERELIMKYYRRPLPGEQCRFLTATDMLERINGGIKEQLSTVRIGMVMRELGIERIRSGNLRGYRLIENTQADIEVKQKSMGSFTEL